MLNRDSIGYIPTNVHPVFSVCESVCCNLTLSAVVAVAMTCLCCERPQLSTIPVIAQANSINPLMVHTEPCRDPFRSNWGGTMYTWPTYV